MIPIRRALAEAVDTRLRTGFAYVYLSEATPPVPMQTDEDDVTDAARRVATYIVQEPMGGNVHEDRQLNPERTDVAWETRIKVVSGWADQVLDVLDQVDDLLAYWQMTVSGVNVGRLEPVPGYDPGPVRRDPNAKPARFFLPMIYQLTATT